MWWLYDVTILNFGNTTSLLDGHWALDSSILFHGLIGAIVQSFFAYRILKVSRQILPWPALVWVGAATRVVLNSYLAYGAFITALIATFSSQYAGELTADLSLGLAVDILTAAVLTWYLARMRSEVQQ